MIGEVVGEGRAGGEASDKRMGMRASSFGVRRGR